MQKSLERNLMKVKNQKVIKKDGKKTTPTKSRQNIGNIMSQ